MMPDRPALRVVPGPEELPEPLLAEPIDLRDFRFLPLDVVRLRDSDFSATVDPEAFKAGVLLWCAAWHQIPAGSLPSDDRILSTLAQMGKGPRNSPSAAWMKVSEEALHGWVLCNDQRYYHPVIVEKALTAAEDQKSYRRARTADALRKRVDRLRRRLNNPNLPEIMRDELLRELGSLEAQQVSS